jgi:hypothetical protein
MWATSEGEYDSCQRKYGPKRWIREFWNWRMDQAGSCTGPGSSWVRLDQMALAKKYLPIQTFVFSLLSLPFRYRSPAPFLVRSAWRLSSRNVEFPVTREFPLPRSIRLQTSVAQGWDPPLTLLFLSPTGPVCSFGWWLMADANLFWEKSIAGWFLMAGLFREKSTVGWCLISEANRGYLQMFFSIFFPNVCFPKTYFFS